MATKNNLLTNLLEECSIFCDRMASFEKIIHNNQVAQHQGSSLYFAQLVSYQRLLQNSQFDQAEAVQVMQVMRMLRDKFGECAEIYSFTGMILKELTP